MIHETRHIVTWCPYDQQEPFGITLDDNQLAAVTGDCMHAGMAHLILTRGDDLRTHMPILAAHINAVIERGGEPPRGQACAEAGPPFHYPL